MFLLQNILTNTQILRKQLFYKETSIPLWIYKKKKTSRKDADE